ncbi:Tudor and KH domain-containing protein [Merluccius polli]|uniref:Tudor and KH domain-containing protein n=1 Tax=Merluccius polli TaxID=89951 RepID=A0AA47NAY9_MERPO|nr:Tudor and KH domain-containing protein [Merluccius polli]
MVLGRWLRVNPSLAAVKGMDVGISKGHVLLNYSRTALFSHIPSAPQRIMSAMKEGPESALSPGRVVALAAGLSIGAGVGYMIYRHLSSSSSSSSSTTCESSASLPYRPRKHTKQTGSRPLWEPVTLSASGGGAIRGQLANCEESMMTLDLDVYRNMSRHQATFLDVRPQVENQPCNFGTTVPAREKSGAHVQVMHAPGGPCPQTAISLLLRGSPEQVLLAKCILDNLAADCEPATEVLDVPQTAFGRIIGRGGESLKLISQTTGARVVCPRERRQHPEAMGKVTITGTQQEVQQAKEMILEKVRDDATVRRKICQSSALRQKRGPHDLYTPKCEVVEPQPPAPVVNNNNNNNPGPCSLKPEDLELCLLSNPHPGNEEGQLDHFASPDSLSEVSKFQIPSPDLSFQPDEHLEVYVSACESPSHFWIQILGVRSLQLDKLMEEMSRLYATGTPTEHMVESVVVGDIVAAPYRDHGTWNRARVLGLLGSGLVDLYYVDFGDNQELPKDSLRNEAWTDAALDDFDKLTYCAEWRPLRAKLCSYSHSEVCTWPSIKLYDNSQAVDLGEELVRLGHAVSCQDSGLGAGDGDNLGSLQRMLDDVIGASSELSLSCISLSDETLNQGPDSLWSLPLITRGANPGDLALYQHGRLIIPWGLMYEDLRGFLRGFWRTPKPRKCRTHK